MVSDDIPLVKKELESYNNIEYIEGNTALEGLFILASCKNNIQTKSSYNWWATYLNNNTGFTIVPCNGDPLYKKNSLTYKIPYTINNIDVCNWKSMSIANYVMQYKDDTGQNIMRFTNTDGNEVIIPVVF